MRENESETEESSVCMCVGGGASKWIKIVSDLLKCKMLRVRQGWEMLSVPVGNAFRMCFPRLLFISLIYTSLHGLSHWPRRPGQGYFYLFLFFPPLTSLGFPVGTVQLAVRNINLTKVWMSWSSSSSSAPPQRAHVHIRPCQLCLSCFTHSQMWVDSQKSWLLQVLGV